MAHLEAHVRCDHAWGEVIPRGSDLHGEVGSCHGAGNTAGADGRPAAET